MKKVLKDYFTFSSRERTGIMVLLILIILVLGINLWLKYTPQQQTAYDYSGFSHELELFSSSITPAENLSDSQSNEMNLPLIRLFPFDPNTATEDELVKLGLDEKIARRVLVYRKKGGRFREKEDLLKIYGFDPAKFSILAPYITIESSDTVIHNARCYNRKEACNNEQVEINSCDTSVLKRLKGIGPVLASRIVKYRRLLGGFYSIDQLTEVYGISDSLFQCIKDYLWIDTTLITRIPINEASEVQLCRHPYIGRYTGKAIVAYRKSTGCIYSMEELVINNIISRENEEKNRAYLLFP
ncbi:MAG: helix-hairpin-helix domain-containing protein [Bacteroidales bacterium]|nr:helix-hairpin-helix domain-containing protein [Bacteroidales bacterium]